MRILIVTPAKRGSRLGNRITADRWAQILRKQHHRVTVKQQFESGSFDLLIALHAKRSADSIAKFRLAFPAAKIILAFTGTDLNRDFGRSRKVDESIRLADWMVGLEPVGLNKLKLADQKKSSVIFQSADPVVNVPKKLVRSFEVSVLGHLRPVKDPFRTAMAVRCLPASSKVKVVHFGSALSTEMKNRAIREMKLNPRYQWFGSVPYGEAQRRLARSRLTVLSSKSEGGPAAITEAIVNGVPILATRIDSMFGILGPSYPGLFDYGDTPRLSELIYRAETEPPFYRRLQFAIKKLKPKFIRSQEAKAWQQLLSRLS